MSVLALVLASCGDASGEASGEENDANSANTEAASGEENNADASASVDVCDCLMNAADENEAQACAPGKSMEELMQMAQDCADKMIDDAVNDAQDMMDGAMEDAEDAMEDAMEEAQKAMDDAMKGM